MTKAKIEIDGAFIEIIDSVGDTLFTFEIKNDQLQILNACGFISVEDNITALEEMLRVSKLLRSMLP